MTAVTDFDPTRYSTAGAVDRARSTYYRYDARVPVASGPGEGSRHHCSLCRERAEGWLTIVEPTVSALPVPRYTVVAWVCSPAYEAPLRAMLARMSWDAWDGWGGEDARRVAAPLAYLPVEVRDEPAGWGWRYG